MSTNESNKNKNKIIIITVGPRMTVGVMRIKISIKNGEKCNENNIKHNNNNK